MIIIQSWIFFLTLKQKEYLSSHLKNQFYLLWSLLLIGSFFFGWTITPKSAKYSKLHHYLLCISMWLCDCQNICWPFGIPGSSRHIFSLWSHLRSGNTSDCSICTGDARQINRYGKLLVQNSTASWQLLHICQEQVSYYFGNCPKKNFSSRSIEDIAIFQFS